MDPNQPSTSPATSTKSHSTKITTPDQSPGNDDDIWGSSSGEEDESSITRSENANHNQNENRTRNRGDILSDLPTIRRQHMTEGYREGLSIGKAKVIQSGFDEGYPIGVRIALRAGKILGILEGYLSCYKVVMPNTSSILTPTTSSSTATSSAIPTTPSTANVIEIDSSSDIHSQIDNDNDNETNTSSSWFIQATKLLEQAKTELSCSTLLTGIDDEVVERAAEDAIPEHIRRVLEKWEGVVLGFAAS